MQKIVQSLISFPPEAVFAAPGFMDTFSRFTNSGINGKYEDCQRFVGRNFQGTIGRMMLSEVSLYSHPTNSLGCILTIKSSLPLSFNFLQWCLATSQIRDAHCRSLRTSPNSCCFKMKAQSGSNRLPSVHLGFNFWNFWIHVSPPTLPTRQRFPTCLVAAWFDALTQFTLNLHLIPTRLYLIIKW